MHQAVTEEAAVLLPESVLRHGAHPLSPEVQHLTRVIGRLRRPWEVAAGSLPVDAAGSARRAAAAEVAEENKRMAAAAAARRVAERTAEAERERRAISAEVRASA